ncbi:MAG: hypothetical protein PHV85_03460 [Desulfovibrionaceae bacterium]|nr:hypothetical protein [Desulfovibrionaceae bacterium]
MISPDSLSLALNLLGPAFFDVLGLAGLGAPILATACELTAAARSKVLADKYGRHASGMGLALLTISLAAVAAGAVAAAVKLPNVSVWLRNPGPMLLSIYVLLAASLVLSAAYRLTWDRSARKKPVHILLGALTSLAGLMTVFACLVAVRAVGLASLSQADSQPVDLALGLSAGSLVWPLSTICALLALAYAAGASLVYLLYRRKKDDYGRDYYAFALRLGARLALWPMLACLLCNAWLFAALPRKLTDLIPGSAAALAWAGGLGLALVCCLLWGLVARSQAPLRLKGLIFAAALGLWASHSLLLTAFLSLGLML